MTAKKKAPVVTSAELDATPPGTKPTAHISSEQIYAGKIVKLDRDHIRYPDGSEADVEIVRHSGASAVVPFLTDPEGDDPQILMLRQYRYAAGGTDPPQYYRGTFCNHRDGGGGSAWRNHHQTAGG